MKAMREGKKVKGKEWFGGAYIRIDAESGNFIDEHNRSVDDIEGYQIINDDWEVVDE
jgi:hypothetical protein